MPHLRCFTGILHVRPCSLLSIIWLEIIKIVHFVFHAILGKNVLAFTASRFVFEF